MIYTRIEFAYYVRRAQTIQFLNSGGLNFWKYTPLCSWLSLFKICTVHGYGIISLLLLETFSFNGITSMSLVVPDWALQP